MADYEVKGKVSTIKATSRASVKIKDCYYTVEYCEERVIPDLPDVDLIQEKNALWDAVNAECDSQVEAIVSTFSKN